MVTDMVILTGTGDFWTGTGFESGLWRAKRYKTLKSVQSAITRLEKRLAFPLFYNDFDTESEE